MYTANSIVRSINSGDEGGRLDKSLKCNLSSVSGIATQLRFGHFLQSQQAS